MENRIINLLIVGNGFDIHCGMNSKFSQYFSEKNKDNHLSVQFKNLNKFFDNILKYKKLSTEDFSTETKIHEWLEINLNVVFQEDTFSLSFWDVYFYLLNYLVTNINEDTLKYFNEELLIIDNWSDVEQQLNYFLKTKPKVINADLTFPQNLIQNVINNLFGRKPKSIHESIYEETYSNFLRENQLSKSDNKYVQFSTSDNSKGPYWNYYNGFYLNQSPALTFATLLLTFFFDKNFVKSKEYEYYKSHTFSHLEVENGYSFLFKELQKFESEFSSFIADDFNDLDLSNLLEMENFYNKLTRNELSNVIDFNYTSIKDTINNLEGKNIPNKELNIHGSFNEKTNISGKGIVIGIDSKGIKSSDPMYKFTKTYQVMTNNLQKSGNLFDKNIKKIIFYGHSLSIQDYSYFQSIFDYYNIYDSDIILEFAYSNFNDNEKQNKSDAIIKLIERYGNTFTNEDHGNNLLSKLLLEGRIKLIEVI